MKKSAFIAFIAAGIMGFIPVSEAQTAPYIVSVSTTRPDGTYVTGQTIDLVVDFSESVQSDSATLHLNTSRGCTFSIYNSSRATCTYTVQPGDYASPLRVTSISGSIRNNFGWSVTDLIPRTNLDIYRQIRIGTGSSYYDPYNPTCAYNYNSYNSSSCNYGHTSIEDLVRQLTALQAQFAALYAARDTQVTQVAVSTPVATSQVLGAYTVHLAFPASMIGRDLFYGMSGEDVGVLQGVLTAEGFYVPPTGYFGPKTQSALLKLQRRIGYPQTGVFDAGMRQWVVGKGY